MRSAILLVLLLGFGLLLADTPRAPAGPAARGKELFSDTQDLAYPSCGQCHSLLPEKEEADAEKAPHLGPGATLWGAAVREGWRNMNTYADVGEASDLCGRVWQQRKGGLKAEQRRDLVAFLSGFGPESGKLPKREVQRAPKMPKDPGELAGGDSARGEKLTARYCGGCHSAADDAISFDLKPGKKKSDLILRKVRGYDSRGKFKPEEGTMSYYTNDRLPDRDLKDILAYLGR